MGSPDLDGLLRLAQDGVAITLDGMAIHPFTVPHDVREPLQVTCTDGDKRLGIVTDLGHVTDHVEQQLAGCHALLLECNHDPELLAASRYPPFLKRRVGGQYGHLSNGASATLARSLHHGGLKHLVAAHLSAQNNRPDLARAALALALDCAASDFGVADPLLGTDWLEI
jgi:phosphoribosyl 1,2-cyclic phosphodiesterase